METLSVTLHKQPWRCVLDPVLALCSSGLEGIYLARQLGGIVELWMFRELFHILDDTPLYLNAHCAHSVYEVNSLDDAANGTGDGLPEIDRRSLNAWEQIRHTTDLCGYQFYWVGDAVSQSRLPEWLQRGETTDHRLRSYELLAQSLEAQSLEAQSLEARDPNRLSLPTEALILQHPIVAACRDTAALAAALGSSVILAAQQSPYMSPYIVQCLERWGLPCQQIADNDAIAGLEKHLFQQLFVEAGLTKLLWSKTLHLSIVHLSVPAAFDPNLVSQDGSDDAPDSTSDFDRPWELENLSYAPLETNLWEGAQVYWYPLTRSNHLPLSPTTHATSLA